MTTTKHTPGPWLRDGHNLVYTLENGVNEMTVQIHHRNGGTDDDAHLIAAAPCLLEALEGLYNAITDVRTTMEDLGHAEEAAAAAIAKAKP